MFYCSNVVYRPFPTSNHNTSIVVLSFILLYIVRFLHQTTTAASQAFLITCCISSVSYIKPQQQLAASVTATVVYRPFPTSNHNLDADTVGFFELYIVRFLHQTTTYYVKCPPLHCCISSVSYIKPQPESATSAETTVVYRPFPTSNHNLFACLRQTY